MGTGNIFFYQSHHKNNISNVKRNICCVCFCVTSMNISFYKYLHVSFDFRNICAFWIARLLTYHFQGSWKICMVKGPRTWTCKFSKTPGKFSEFLHRNTLQIDKLWRYIGSQCRTPLDFQGFKAQGMGCLLWAWSTFFVNNCIVVLDIMLHWTS